MQGLGYFLFSMAVCVVMYFIGRADQRRADQGAIDAAHRMVIAARQAEQWLVSDYPEAAETATWIRRCGEGRESYGGNCIRERLHRGERFDA